MSEAVIFYSTLDARWKPLVVGSKILVQLLGKPKFTYGKVLHVGERISILDIKHGPKKNDEIGAVINWDFEHE